MIRREGVREGSWGKDGWRGLHGAAVSSGDKDSGESLLASPWWNLTGCWEGRRVGLRML